MNNKQRTTTNPHQRTVKGSRYDQCFCKGEGWGGGGGGGMRFLRSLREPPGVVQDEVSDSVRVGHGVGEREEPSETVAEQHKPLQSHSLPPPLQS